MSFYHPTPAEIYCGHSLGLRDVGKILVAEFLEFLLDIPFDVFYGLVRHVERRHLGGVFDIRQPPIGDRDGPCPDHVEVLRIGFWLFFVCL